MYILVEGFTENHKNEKIEYSYFIEISKNTIYNDICSFIEWIKDRHPTITNVKLTQTRLTNW